MNRLEIVKLASRVGAKVDAPADWGFTLDQLEAFTKEVMPKPLDYTEMTSGMREEIVYVIQKQLGVI